MNRREKREYERQEFFEQLKDKCIRSEEKFGIEESRARLAFYAFLYSAALSTACSKIGMRMNVCFLIADYSTPEGALAKRRDSSWFVEEIMGDITAFSKTKEELLVNFAKFISWCAEQIAHVFSHGLMVQEMIDPEKVFGPELSEDG